MKGGAPSVKLHDVLVDEGVLPEVVPVRVNLDNVARYYWRSQSDQWGFEHFPNIAPPWPNVWMEWRNPSRVWAEGEWREHPAMTFGGLFLAKDVSYGGWECEAHLWVATEANSRIVGGVWMIGLKWRVRPDGGLDEHGFGDGKTFMVAMVLKDAAHEELIRGQAATFLHVPCFAVSLTHCKNVELVTVRPPAEKRARARGRLMSACQVIEIDPARRILQTEGRAEVNGLRAAMTICRGHFKDYRQRGLFGRDDLRGRYWWPMHVRGGTPADADAVYGLRLPAEDVWERAPEVGHPLGTDPGG